MHLFYDPKISGNFHTLDPKESVHCIRVLRLNKNDIVYLTDGMGQLYKSKIIAANSKKCELKIIETFSEYNKPSYYVHIAIAPTKSIERFEWFLEKVTEIGINEITPIICERSERRIIKPERLTKVISAAMKQSIKAYFPKLNKLIFLPEFLKTSLPGNNFIANCEENPENHLLKHVSRGDSATILIGPEGDFSPAELELALNANYKSISLGISKLRTETAGIVACHTVNLLNQTK